ncbi:hypothetical protein [Leuconostoc citreum]|uniref:hypothetical protein n=1 Tax=Leuconostoc citreum TaxID=33964 RepID=UPI000BFEE235|nr:hypothetical protein [Leuconostoc citreum]
MKFDIQIIGSILAFMGVCLTIIWTQHSTSKQLSQRYDQSSDWTKHLVDVVETPTSELNEKQLLTVKRALRIYQKKDVPPLNVKDSFLIVVWNYCYSFFTLKCFLKKRKHNADIFDGIWDFMCDMSHTYIDRRLDDIRKENGRKFKFDRKKFKFEETQAENIRLIAQTLLTNR